jgi:hypothetical protein
MFVPFRAITYSTLFIALHPIYLPARVLSRSGITHPSASGAAQIAGMIAVIAGGSVRTRCPKAFSRFNCMPHRRTFLSAPKKIVRNDGFTRALAPMI